MKDQELHFQQWVPEKPEKVFAFFCNPQNLETLTPDFLHFKMLHSSTAQVEEGTLIDYQLRIHGFPARWRTEIRVWKPIEEFQDIQLKGPYSKWEHTHRFLPQDGGTLMEDQIVYRLPLGAMGQFFAGIFVRKDVERIFTYRKMQIDRLFGSPSG